MEQQFFVGSYSLKGGYFPNVLGEGLSTLTINLKTGKIQRKAIAKTIENATYISRVNADTLLVAIDNYYEFGKVVYVKVEDNGSLKQIISQSTHGTALCHLAYDDMNAKVYVISYLNSKLDVFELKENQLLPSSFVYSYTGKSIDKDRQEASHAHHAAISNKGQWLYVCDLGSDKIWIHNLSDTTSSLIPKHGIDVPKGYGPRHIEVHPKKSLLYLICELSAHIITYRINVYDGLLEQLDDKCTLPSDFSEKPSAAAIRIHPSNKTLYVSNRIHDSISVFSIDKVTGLLTFKVRFSTKGKEPRDFNIDPTGNWLVVANQYSNNLVSFKLNPETGLPMDGDESVFECGSPVCILF